MPTLRIPLVCALLLAFTAPVGHASHAEGCVPEVAMYGTVLSTNPDQVEGAPTYYVALDNFQLFTFWSVWIYEESNGLAGLQRADEVQWNENCGHGGDTIIF